ncbi:MAG: 3-isopropylmalate dehydratase small subunit, partial [Solirubrobacteraceae bacterium]
AVVLVAGPNFGTGSSREHAVWALMDYGFEAVVSPRFGDIFRTNCTKIGLLPVALDVEACSAIADAGEAQVDLAAQQVRWPGGSASFEIDPEVKHRLLNGLDDITLTLGQTDAIAAYERDRERTGPDTSVL